MLDTANSCDLMGRPRITITVSEDIYSYLSEWAEREERPLANLAAYLLSQAAREHEQQAKSSSPKKGKGAA